MSHRIPGALVALTLLGASSCHAPPAGLPSPPPGLPRIDEARQIPAADEDAERAWLTSLGVKIPAGALLRVDPFAEPIGARSFVVPTEWYRRPSPKDVAADDLRADLPILRRVMEKAYGGWATAERRGFRWNEWFARWEASLAAEAGKRLSPEEAFAPWGHLIEFQLDNHSGPVRGPRWFSGSRSAVLASAPEHPCLTMTTDKGTFPLDPADPAQRPRRAQLFDATTHGMTGVSYLSYPAVRGELTAVSCGAASIAAAPAWNGTWRDHVKDSCALNHTDNDEPGFRVIEPGFAYLRLPTFSKVNHGKVEELAERLPGTLDDLRVLIVDLRVNDGGDAPIKLLLWRWLDPLVLASISEWTHELRTSCVYDSLRWGYAQNSSLSLKAPVSPGVKSMLESALGALMTPASEGCPVKVTVEKAKQSFAQHELPVRAPPSGPIFLVLTDNFCGSDCELMVSTLAKLPGAVVAGTNSFGVGQFIQPGYFFLPHARVPFRIALGRSDFYGDERSFDGYGLDVDVLLTTHEANSAESVLALAHALAAQAISPP